VACQAHSQVRLPFVPRQPFTLTTVSRNLECESVASTTYEYPRGMFRLELSRSQILGFRRRVGSLVERLPVGTKSLRRAAWAGLQDSMPRAALLSIHARVEGAGPTTWEDPSLVQLGARGLAPTSSPRRTSLYSRSGGCRTTPVAARGRTTPRPGSTHSSTADGCRSARPATKWACIQIAFGTPRRRARSSCAGTARTSRSSGPGRRPGMDPRHARLELVRRYLHVFGPATAPSFARWAGIRAADARLAWEALDGALTPVRTPVGDAWILSEDETAFRTQFDPAALARLLPSGDAYCLMWGADRTLLVPDAKRRAALWTTRVWPGALVVNGEIVGVWRRSAGEVSIEAWRRLSSAEREAVEAEAVSLPLPGLNRPIAVRWS
jgi:hypothetical protein